MAVKGENGMKKKFYQKWWFWLIIALLVIGAVGNAESHFFGITRR